MAEEVTKYVSTVEFDAKQAIKNLTEYQNKLNQFQKKQMTMARASATGRGGSRGRGLSNPDNLASKTRFADMLRKEDAASKNFNNNLELKHINQQEQARVASKNFINNLELKHIADQERAKDKAIKDRNSARNAANNLELKNVAATEKAMNNVKRSGWYMKQYASENERAVIANLQNKLATATSAEQVRNMAAVARNDLRVLRERTREMQSQNFLLRRMQSSSQQMAGNMVSAFALAAGTASITRVGQQFEGVNSAMLAVSGSTELAADNMKFIREESYRLGKPLKDSADSFAKMLAARGNLSQQQVKDTFTSIQEVAVVLGLSAVQANRGSVAIQQMMS